VRRLGRLAEALSDLGAGLAGVATLLLALMVAAGVVARRGLGAPLLFVEELSGYLVAGIVFLGLAHTFRTGGHIRVEVLLGRTRGPLRRFLQRGALALAVLWAALVLGGTARLVHEYLTQQVRSFAYLQTPLWMPGLAMVLGAALLLLQCLARLGGPEPDAD
jgi:TRAP-type C4-dicarboxylate transport system permease small subunit